MTTCNCTRFKTNETDGICVLCKHEAQYPWMRKFAESLRGKCQPLPRYKRKRADYTSPYSCKFQGR